MIGDAVRSLLTQSYPVGLFDVYVIPNHCTDRTAEEAAAAGAKLLFVSDAVKCKGDVLREVIGTLLPEAWYDAYCVLDADNVVNEDFLVRLNDAFVSGGRVVKSRIAGKRGADALSGCYAVYHEVFNHWFNLARETLGLSARLVGTGFAVHRTVLEEYGGWPTETVTEDAELAARLAEQGERVRYAPEAVAYDEAPSTFSLSMRQRRRWSAGIMQNARRSARSLLRALGRPHRAIAADELLMLLAPYRSAFGTAAVILSVIGAERAGRPLPLVPYLIGTAAAAAAFWLIAGAIARHCRGIGWRGVLLFPVFMASWLPVNLSALICPPGQWKPIPHGK